MITNWALRHGKTDVLGKYACTVDEAWEGAPGKSVELGVATGTLYGSLYGRAGMPWCML